VEAGTSDALARRNTHYSHERGVGVDDYSSGRNSGDAHIQSIEQDLKQAFIDSGEQILLATSL
jgi:hypothetical protein